jgi:hypothetical protein
MSNIEPTLVKAEILFSKDFLSGKEEASGKVIFGYDCKMCDAHNTFDVNIQSPTETTECISCKSTYEIINRHATPADTYPLDISEYIPSLSLEMKQTQTKTTERKRKQAWEYKH